MAIIQPDLSEAEDLAPIDPGTYKARIVKGDRQDSAEKKLPMYVPTFKVEVNGKERTRKAFIMTQGPGSFNFDQILRVCGETHLPDQIKANPGRVPFDTDLLNGKELNVVITHNEYKGQMRDQIQSFLPL